MVLEGMAEPVVQGLIDLLVFGVMRCINWEWCW